MGEPLTLEEAKDIERKEYIQSIILLFTIATGFIFTSLLVCFFNILAAGVWGRGHSLAGYADMMSILAIVPSIMVAPLSYLTVYSCAKGRAYALCFANGVAGLGVGVWSKLIFSPVTPGILLYFSVIHEVTSVCYLLALLNHKLCYFNSVEFGWDEFDCMDKIVKPGMEAALIKLMIKSPPMIDDGGDNLVLKGDAVNFEPTFLNRPGLPVVELKQYHELDNEFQSCVRGHADQKRQNNEWMQSVKYEDMRENPMHNAWAHDRIGRTLGKTLRDEKLRGEARMLAAEQAARKEIGRQNRTSQEQSDKPGFGRNSDQF